MENEGQMRWDRPEMKDLDRAAVECGKEDAIIWKRETSRYVA